MTSIVRDPIVLALASAYSEIVMGSADAEEAHELAVSFGMLASVDRLFVVGRAVRDAMPWVPLLRVLMRASRSRDPRRSAVSAAHLYAVACEMLARQGLALVRPEDCLARPSAIEQAFASLTNTKIEPFPLSLEAKQPAASPPSGGSCGASTVVH
ncbi:MAG: hypothetical protein U0234_00565 [Sandaracinus sp.]